MKFSLWESKRLLQLAVPVFFAQIILVLMSVVDTIMAGQVSANDLAALSIATGVINPVIFSLQGILLALTSVVAHCYGSNDKTGIKHYFQQSIYLVVLLSAMVFLLPVFTPFIFSKLGADPIITATSQDYVDYVKFGVLGFLVFSIYRSVSEGIGLTKVTLYISLIGLVVNIVANYIFIYGKLGMPALGAAGCGVATSLVACIMALSQVVYSFRNNKIKGRWLLNNFEKPNFTSMFYLIKIGFPIALATFFEISLFACIPLFIADLGAVMVSGHQIAASVTAVLFMMPLSLSMAIAIRVGNLSGQKAYAQLKVVIFTSFCIAILIAFIVAIVTFVFRAPVTYLYTQDENVAQLAMGILILACFYQLPDALQVAAGGVLRGLKHTKPIIWISFISYWLIGFALGYVLAKTDLIIEPMGAKGFWVGIIFGLIVAACLLLISVRNRLVQMVAD